MLSRLFESLVLVTFKRVEHTSDGAMDLPLDDETLQRLYAWIDEIPLSRPKKSIARDFSDGILTAEVVAFYFPKLVQMHNYSPANSAKQKLYNWTTLNRACVHAQCCCHTMRNDRLVANLWHAMRRQSAQEAPHLPLERRHR